MSGYDASVLNSPETRLAVIVPNWLGDGVMAMPALQVLRKKLHPEAKLDVIARPGQAGLWSMHPSPNQVVPLTSKTGQLCCESRIVRQKGYSHVVLMPNSFRSALLPALARIPYRRGTGGQHRGFLLQDCVSLTAEETRHQQWENARLLLPEVPDHLPPPMLTPSAEAQQTISSHLEGLPRPWLAAIPGAARGPSKQWPSDRFAAVASAWQADTGGSVIWLGTPADEAICSSLAASGGATARSLAGKTSLSEFTACLQAVDAVVANDSGGMHLATAVGTPVVAIFGKTDPSKTGPLHPNAVVIQQGSGGDRRIAREDAEAVKALEAVTVEQVIQPVLAIGGPHG